MRLTNFTSSTGSNLAGLVWAGNPEHTILLVHGLGSNARTWIRVAELLNAKGSQVVAYDQRSHGQSEQVGAGFDFKTYVADLQLVIGSVATAPPVTVGQSWGGNVVVEHGAHHEITTTIGIDGGFIRLADRFPVWEDCADVLAPPRFAGATRPAVEGYLRTAHPDWSDIAIEGALGNFEPQPDGTVMPYLQYDQHMAILRSLWEHDPAVALAHVSVPTHAIMARPGLASNVDPRTMGFDEIVLLTGDHDLHLQQPERVSELIWGMTTWGL
ncbi:MAG: alpha/beta hydrolase [Acidimicrobiia bacterium]|nr:alpha/beta hydrolase [Acidimicrobiia bacterium]